MTVAQEDALYDFLDDASAPFTTAAVTAAIRRKESGGTRRLAEEVEAFLHSRKLAFPLEPKTIGGSEWVSRRAFFSAGVFSISPSRLEIRNGILIPGHRCVPFANPILLPHEFQFRFEGTLIPNTTTEGPPEDFYPFYDLYGEEYAPQYLARDNPENEESFNADAYEDPPEVSIKTLDMRALYRELAFVPGDRFSARVIDWKGGVFELERNKRTGSPEETESLSEWMIAAEKGFLASFESLGPGASTEEQIAFSYWFGGQRMLRTPSYSLEEYLYEKTDKIETVPYGMETRFWRAGKEIPDRGPWTELSGPPDKTDVELLLARLGVPVSEYVVESYIRDSFYLKDSEVHRVLERLLPPSIKIDQNERLFIAQFVVEARDDLTQTYNYFSDKDMGPLRSRVAELHTAVIDLVARLGAEGDGGAWLPKHAFVTLSQLQTHAANLLEDLDYDDEPDDREITGMENSLDGMIDTYEDLKEAIDEARDGFRRSRLSLVRSELPEGAESWRTVQLALSGTGVWRRLSVPASMSLALLHVCIQAAFGWRGGRLHGFVAGGRVFGPGPEAGVFPEKDVSLGSLVAEGVFEFTYDYDYGSEWEARITILHASDSDPSGHPRCLAGEGAAPPETIGGPLRFRRFISAFKGEAGGEKELALAELGSNFDPDAFDSAAVNERLSLAFHAGKGESE
ncbi:MAG: plasmid pRiA4b ORF-3 family protein [Treponemataceae bacterium]